MNHQKFKMAAGMLVAIIMEIQQCMSVILAILETLLSSVSLMGTGQPNLSVMVGEKPHVLRNISMHIP